MSDVERASMAMVAFVEERHKARREASMRVWGHTGASMPEGAYSYQDLARVALDATRKPREAPQGPAHQWAGQVPLELRLTYDEAHRLREILPPECDLIVAALDDLLREVTVRGFTRGAIVIGLSADKGGRHGV